MIYCINQFRLDYVVVTNKSPISVAYNNKRLLFAHAAYLSCGSVPGPRLEM